jgi:hypothetical protein
MSFDLLFKLVEHVDGELTALFDGAPLVVALGIAFVLGLRHASDPDHLVAVTSLVAADGGDTRQAARLGAWWGTGHAAVLLLLGMPLIVLKGELPAWLGSSAEKTVGVVILALAVRVMLKWLRGDYRATVHSHDRGRTPVQALSIGMLHGLAGTGAVVVLLVAALPSQLAAVLSLAVFAPMSVVSMAACTSAFAWLLTRPVVEPVYHTILIPGLGLFGVLFGVWYVGIA